MMLLHVATVIYPLQLPVLLQVVMQYEELLLNFGLAIAAAPSAVLCMRLLAKKLQSQVMCTHCPRQWPVPTSPCTQEQAGIS